MILVVDDNKDFARSLVDLLELAGQDADVAFSGNDAIKVAA